jgi:tetratricopeptide (TPR) repeat protein
VNSQQSHAQISEVLTAAKTPLLAGATVQFLVDHAIKHHEAGRLDDAERLYAQVLAADPQHADALHLLGVIACQTGRPALAVERIIKAIRINGSAAYYHSNLSNALILLGRFDDAAVACRKAIALEPNFAQAHANLGTALAKAGRFNEAIAACDTAIRLDPDDASSYANLGDALWSLGRAEAAIAAYKTAIRLSPGDASAHASLGHALWAMGLAEAALEACNTATRLNPNHAIAHLNLGNALEGLGRLEESLAAYRKAISLKPDIPESHFNLGHTLLKTGAFEEGWDKFEWRWKMKQMAGARRDFGKPFWQGEFVAGRTLLIHAEQGFGDNLQFCRYATLAAARGLRVILEAPKPLMRLLRGLAGVAHVIGYGDALPPFDFHVPVMSLPRAFGTTIETIPGKTPYLHADQDSVEVWRQRLSESVGQSLKIGVAWAGNPRNHSSELAAVDRRRSLAPEFLAPLFEIQGLRFLSLQKAGPPAPADFPLVDHMQGMEDFADTAALIANLDLVISVDTAIAHLAGALGKPVWLLNRFDSCWRWLTGRRDTPWYPDMRLYRQPAPGEWRPVVAEIAVDLALFQKRRYSRDGAAENSSA